MQSTRDPSAVINLHRAQAARAQLGSGLQFRSPRAALSWYYPWCTTLLTPSGQHPHTETASNGSEVVVRVDGGKGGDFDDVLATMITIGQALDLLRKHSPQEHRLIERLHLHGDSQAEAARLLGVSQSTASSW